MITIKTFAVILLLASIVGVAFVSTYEHEPPVDPAWAVSGSTSVPEHAVTVRFTGTSTLLFSDGQTHWLIDGWFSRPGLFKLAFGKIAPDLKAISDGLAANQITELAAVIPVHSHYDHAMDAPEVAQRTGAILMGSEATANIGRGWGLDERQIQVFRNRIPVTLGDFTITPIESRHFQFPDERTRELTLSDPDIDSPLVPPVRSFDYRLGEAYVLHVAHPLGTFMIVGSAGYEHGGLAGLQADVVFLGVGGLGGQSDEYRSAYWHETVATVTPNTVIPIHFDSLTAPIEGPFRGSSLVLGLLSGGEEKTLPFLKSQEVANPKITFMTLPRYDEVVLFPPPGS